MALHFAVESKNQKSRFKVKIQRSVASEDGRLWGLAPLRCGLREDPAGRVVPGVIPESGHGRDRGLALGSTDRARCARRLWGAEAIEMEVCRRLQSGHLIARKPEAIPALPEANRSKPGRSGAGFGPLRLRPPDPPTEPSRRHHRKGASPHSERVLRKSAWDFDFKRAIFGYFFCSGKKLPAISLRSRRAERL